eukprot:CAMPEP_0198141002 /NCGR_PEP_ID=MMETSP1443-20131203/4073_1 /TAXON_ID=186043 /ORGANISM="Entomoneis sp., Strain CCMP2396" /LENGTH=213 /DNA_ID=CAMNT_0043803597 /DNA_START=279 /DNA_END=920 /DNA_ORIENTATION=-
MKTPASILAGAIVGLGFGNPLPANTPIGEKENCLEKAIRKSYLFVAGIALLSQLGAIMHATVAVNKLTECVGIGKAESVWHLIQRDFDLSWSGTNAFFVVGMLAYSYIIGVRSYFIAGRGTLGQGVAALAGSSLMFMLGIVNRGVAAGSGDGQNYGKTVLSLFTHYGSLILYKNTHLKTMRPLEIGSIVLFIYALVQGVRAVLQSACEKEKSE